jgi:hypothetical protein
MPYPGPAKSPAELLQTCLAGPTGDRMLASIFTGKVGAVIWATGQGNHMATASYFLQKAGIM